MELGLLSDGDAMNVKAAFDNRFILSLEEFAASHRRWLAENGVALQTWYACAYRWDKMGPDVRPLSYDAALTALKSRERTVFIMSEDHGDVSCSMCALEGYEKNQKGFVAQVSALALAERIEYEWNEEYIKEAFLGKDKLLPDDLYIFDIWFIWLLVFAHETDKTGAQYCMSFGI